MKGSSAPFEDTVSRGESVGPGSAQAPAWLSRCAALEGAVPC